MRALGAVVCILLFVLAYGVLRGYFGRQRQHPTSVAVEWAIPRADLVTIDGTSGIFVNRQENPRIMSLLTHISGRHSQRLAKPYADCYALHVYFGMPGKPLTVVYGNANFAGYAYYPSTNELGKNGDWFFVPKELQPLVRKIGPPLPPPMPPQY